VRYSRPDELIVRDNGFALGEVVDRVADAAVRSGHSGTGADDLFRARVPALEALLVEVRSRVTEVDPDLSRSRAPFLTEPVPIDRGFGGPGNEGSSLFLARVCGRSVMASLG